MLQKILYAEVNAIGLFIVALMCNKGKYSVKHQLSQQLFENLLYIMGMMLVLDTVGWVVNGCSFKGAFAMNLISSAVFMGLTGVLGFAWLRYCDCILLGGHQLAEKNIFYVIPAVVNGIVSLMSIAGRGAFYIDTMNMYHRGPLYFVHLFCLGIYMLASIAVIIFKLLRTPKNERENIYSFMLFLMPPAIGILIQGFVYGISILLVLCVLSGLMIFINFQNDLISIDLITGISNRLAFEKFTHRNTMSIKKDQVFFMIMIDVDDFKKINDSYGHLIGDAVLKVIGNVLKDCCESTDVPARIGGDEFAVVGYRRNAEEVNDLAKRIDRKIELEKIDKKTNEPLSVSVGSAIFGHDGISSFDELMYNADKEMYETKRKKKANNKERT